MSTMLYDVHYTCSLFVIEYSAFLSIAKICQHSFTKGTFSWKDLLCEMFSIELQKRMS